MRDNWCVGFTDRFTVAVWVGNFSGASMHDVSGTTGAAPVWLDIVNYLYDRFGARSPAPPAGVTNRAVSFPAAVEPARTEWFVAGTQPDLPAAPLDDRPQILFPAAASMIALDPDIPRGRQEIAFVANASARGSRWTLDRRDLGPVTGVKLWAPVPGIHTLALVGSSGKPFDLLTFKVRGAMTGETSGDLHD